MRFKPGDMCQYKDIKEKILFIMVGKKAREYKKECMEKECPCDSNTNYPNIAYSYSNNDFICHVTNREDIGKLKFIKKATADDLLKLIIKTKNESTRSILKELLKESL